jgi:hypothetical protein
MKAIKPVFRTFWGTVRRPFLGSMGALAGRVGAVFAEVLRSAHGGLIEKPREGASGPLAPP